MSIQIHPLGGEFFRTEFEQIGGVRSLIPSHVHVMALTGTAIKCVITKVSTILGLVRSKDHYKNLIPTAAG